MVLYLPQRVCFLNRAGQYPHVTAFTSTFRSFADQDGPKEIPWKLILTIFKCKNEFLKQLRLKKQMKKKKKKKKKNGVICLVFISPFWVKVLRLSKNLSFLQFFSNVSKRSKTVIATFVYGSQSSRFVLLEDGIDYSFHTHKISDLT